MISTDDIKKNIDLVSFIEHNLSGHYERDRTGGEKSIVFRNKVSDEKLVITYKDGKSLYIDNHNPSDKGSIIDFVKNRIGKSIQALDSSKSDYWNTLQVLSQGFSSPINTNVFDDSRGKAEERMPFNVEKYRLKALHDTEYLHVERCISLDILKDPIFKDHVFNNSFKGEVNTVFPLYNSNRIDGILLRNINLKIVAKYSNRENSFWMSALPKEDNIKVVITESPIDSLSYAQLNSKKGEKDVLYTSFAGNVSKNQVKNLFKYLRLNNKKVINFPLANDNDLGGVKANLFFIQEVAKGKKGLSIGTHFSDKQEGLHKVSVTTKSAEEGHYLHVQLETYLKTSGAPFFKVRSFDKEIKITVSNDLKAMQSLNDALIKSMALDDLLVIRRSVLKDWNEDLKASMRIRQGRKVF